MRTIARRVTAAAVLVLLCSGGSSVASAAALKGKAATDKEVRQVLAALPVLPRAKEHAKAVEDLNTPITQTSSPNLIDHARWWTAPGTAAQALTWYRHHPPAHTVLGGSATAGGPHEVTLHGLIFWGDNNYPDVQISLEGYHGWVAVRADVQAVWAPTRPGWSYVPKTATSVAVTVVRQSAKAGHGAPTVRRTLTGARLTRLVGLVDSFGELPPEGPFSCPADPLGTVATDTLVFHTASGSFTVKQYLARCGGGLGLRQGKRGIPLAGSIDDAVLKALKLHAGYGEH